MFALSLSCSVVAGLCVRVVCCTLVAVKNAVYLKIVYIVDHVAATRTKDSCFDRSLPAAQAVDSEDPQAEASCRLAELPQMWFANVVFVA